MEQAPSKLRHLYSLRNVIGHAEIASDRPTAVVTERAWRAAQGAKP